MTGHPAVMDQLAAHVRSDWLAGWHNDRSFHGPVVISTAAGEPGPAGLVGFGDRSDGVVELRIDPAHTVSQRAAGAAGFSPAGAVESHPTQLRMPPMTCASSCGGAEIAPAVSA